MKKQMIGMALACGALMACADEAPEGNDLGMQEQAINGEHLRLFSVAEEYLDGTGIEAYAPANNGTYNNYALRALCVRDNDEAIVTIKAKMVPFKANGQIDEEQAVWVSGGRIPDGDTERCVDVGRGNLVVGVSGRIRDNNMTHLQLYYQKWNSSKKMLEGGEPEIKLADGQSGVAEEKKMMVKDIISGETLIGRTFITRVGMRDLDDNIKNIYLETRTPCKDPEQSSCSTENW
jgi:hypothetical protein